LHKEQALREPKKAAIWQGSTAVVTGASGGIGAAIARSLANSGLTVAAVSRSADRLETLASQTCLAGGKIISFPVDLQEPESPARLFEAVNRKLAPVSVLVNNAGVGWYGYFDEMPPEMAQEMIRVNVNAVVSLTALFLPGMKARRLGRVINIGSIVGGIPSQGVVMYAATKAFMDAFTTALHRELVGTGVQASVVRPGPVRSEFCSRAAARENGRPLPTERMGVSTESVAKAACSLLRRPRRMVYVPGILAVTPWVEACFGWLMDGLGPLLLKNKKAAF
jgi:short-subunit dehydrogenase